MPAPSASQISGITNYYAHLKIATERLHDSAGPLYFAPKEVGKTRKRESGGGSDERKTLIFFGSPHIVATYQKNLHAPAPVSESPYRSMRSVQHESQRHET